MTRVYLLHKYFVRRLKDGAFSGPVIQSMHGEFDVLPGDFPEGHFLWEERPDESSHILVGTTLPRGVSKIEVGSEFAGDPLVLGELPTVVGRQRMNHWGYLSSVPSILHWAACDESRSTFWWWRRALAFCSSWLRRSRLCIVRT